jgi:hypothetical protein
MFPSAAPFHSERTNDMTPIQLATRAFPGLSLPLTTGASFNPPALDAWILKELREDARRHWRYALFIVADDFNGARQFMQRHVRESLTLLTRINNAGVSHVRINAGRVTVVFLKADSLGREAAINIAPEGLGNVLGELHFRYQWPVEGQTNGRKAVRS